MTPEQLAAAKSIVQHAAVNSLETDEVMLLGHALQEIDRLRAAILEYQQAPATMEASADREIGYCHRKIKEQQVEIDRLRSAPVAVEVPEPSVQQWIYEVLKPAEADPEPHATLRHATRWFREHIRSIPSDRVLKEGEREELETWKRIAQDAEKERDEAQSAVARLLAWKRTILARMGALLDSATNARGAFSSDALRSGEAEERAHEPKHPPFPERPTPRVEEEAFEIPLSAMTLGQVIQSLHPRFWV